MDYDDHLYRSDEEEARPYMGNPVYARSEPEMMFRLQSQCGELEGTHEAGTLEELFPDL
ncbi:hypothetical protein JW898_05530 [Candidatus Woesearchaeota archaeon]|nr:hypothetical protein [Candidatus Woesearchaeota archaeon]